MNDSIIRTVLRKARMRLDNPRRWIQGDVTGLNELGETTYCLIGAINHENSLDSEDSGAVFTLLLEAIKKCGFRYDAIADFNDSPLRKHHTILRVLDTALQSA